MGGGGDGNDGPPGDTDLGSKVMSYKGDVDQRKYKSHEGENKVHHGKAQGKRTDPEARDESENYKYQRAYRSYKHHDGRRYGGEGSRPSMHNDPKPRVE